MEQLLKKIDVDKYIGDITLTNGEKLLVPKISMLKIIKIVKFLGIDAMKLYENMKGIVNDSSLDEMTKVIAVLDSLKEEQLIHLFSILLDMEDEEALNLDPNEMLDVIILYLDKTNITKTFTQVRTVYKKMFNKELPDIMTWVNQKLKAADELQKRRMEAMKAVEAEEAGNKS